MGLGSLFRGKECEAAGSSLFKNAGEGQIGGEDYDVKGREEGSKTGPNPFKFLFASPSYSRAR